MGVRKAKRLMNIEWATQSETRTQNGQLFLCPPSPKTPVNPLLTPLHPMHQDRAHKSEPFRLPDNLVFLIARLN